MSDIIAFRASVYRAYRAKYPVLHSFRVDVRAHHADVMRHLRERVELP